MTAVPDTGASIQLKHTNVHTAQRLHYSDELKCIMITVPLGLTNVFCTDFYSLTLKSHGKPKCHNKYTNVHEKIT